MTNTPAQTHGGLLNKLYNYDNKKETIHNVALNGLQFTSCYFQLNQLRTDYTALQDNAIQQLTQMDSDARLNEMREQLMQIRAASESTEEKLRSEVNELLLYW